MFVGSYSQSMIAFYPSEWWNVFAGLHIMAATMISYGDNTNTPQLGGDVALAYTANPSGAVASAYANVISSISSGGCNGGRYGGSLGGGIDGCGCFMAMTVTTNGDYGDSGNPMMEDWGQLTADDYPAQTGNTYWYATMVCNYDPTYVQWQGGDWATAVVGEGDAGLQLSSGDGGF